jgi:hypothetical protein
MRTVNSRHLPILLLFSLMIFCPQADFAQSAVAAVAATEISADQGPCSALITVTGADSKPVYNAKVTARVRSGFMSTKKLDLETYTSASGQVKVVGLPEAPKKPVFIYISKDDKMESVEFKPDLNCRATFDVQLK